MALGFIFPRSPNPWLYNYALSSLYKPGLRIYDPDFSISQDPQAIEKIERDTVIAHAMQMRSHLVAGREWTILPGGSSQADKELASIVEDIMREIPCFAQARFLLSRAVFRGYTLARIYGERKYVQLGEVSIQNWWIPTKLMDVDKRRVRWINSEADGTGGWKVQQQIFSMQRIGWLDLENPEWFVQHVYNDDEESLGYGRGLMNALFFYWRAKTIALEEGLQGLERWAQGQVMAKIDPEAQGKTLAQAQQDYLTTYEKFRSRHFFAHDRRDEFTVLPGPGEGHQMVIQFIGYLDSAMRTLILGSNLPTSATDGGSFALAQVQENSTEALIQYDREILAETITRDLVGLILRLNRPQLSAVGLIAARPPRFAITQQKRSDPTQAAQVITAALAARIPLRKDEVYRELGFSVPTENDDVIEAGPALPGAGPLDLPGL